MTNNYFKKVLNTLLGFGLIAFSVNAQTIIYPSADTYSHSGNTSDNYGAEELIRVKKSSGTTTRNAYLSFDVSDESASYEQIILKLTQTNANTGGVLLRGLESDFDESTLTWDNAPSDEFFIRYGGLRVDDEIFYDVTDYVNEMISESGNANFLLFSEMITSATNSFISKETTSYTENEWPQLIMSDSKDYDIAVFGFDQTTVTALDTRVSDYDDGSVWDTTFMDYDNGYVDELDDYGGLISCEYSYDATGYFRVEQIDDVWHMIDPIGNLFFTVGVNSVQSPYSVDPVNDLKEIGVNTFGSWSDETFENIVYTPRLNALVNFKNNDRYTDGSAYAAYSADVLPVFEPNFDTWFDGVMEDWLEDYIGDPWVLGYFLDNELHFSGSQIEDSLTLDTTNPQYINADAFMIDKYGTGYSVDDITSDDELEYVGIVAEKYFSVITTAIRAVDPDHMLIGTRLNGYTRYRTTVLSAAGSYLDVLSINYYREWEPQQEDLDLWYENAGIPWFTTEFYTKGEDTTGAASTDGNVLDNISGAGWTVPTQEDRSYHYENWVQRTLKDPNCVGWHWFRFSDDDTSNKGILNANKDTWYTELYNSFDQVNNVKYALRDQMLHGYTTNSCDETLSVISLNVNDPSNAIDIYPNPVPSSQGEITVSLQGVQSGTISIYDMGGNTVFSDSKIDAQMSINTDDLTPGFYLVQVKDNSSSRTYVTKLIIE